MRRSPTFWKLFLGNLLVMVAVAAVVGVLAYRRLDQDYRRRTRQDQDRLARIVAARLGDLPTLEPNRIDPMCKSMPADPSNRLTVIAPDGAVLGDSTADPARMVNHRTADRPEVIAALDGRPGDHIRHSGTVGMEYRYVAVPVFRDGNTVAAVRLAVPVRTIAEGEAFFRDALIFSACGAVLVAVLLGLLVSWIWAAPLNRVSVVARQIAAGDLTRRARAMGTGELADLARALNEMRDSLVGQVRQTRAQQQNLQTVIAGLRDGIIAVRADGTVAVMNRAAADLLCPGAGEAAGRRLEAVVPSLDIINLYQDAATTGKPVAALVELDRGGGRRILDVQAATVPSEASDIRGILVVRDVTELANAAAMKSQFVANASHELRTPLAAVRAAADALADADPSDRDAFSRCLGILDRNVGRLEALTGDLLDLHMVESGKLPLSLKPVRLDDLARRVRAEFEAPARDKNLRLAVRAEPPEHEVRSDRGLLELILRNLVDNAIKFTPSGGAVECGLEAAGTGAVLRVRDTGVGISRQDQGRVFERFFQVDAARTGDARLRGTGLGLAIVKHAADRLGAKVELHSAVGEGTTITVTLAENKGESRISNDE